MIFNLTEKINTDIFKMNINDIMIPILFAGDRQTCCDYFLHMYQGDELIGLSSFSLQGEMYNDTPEIVGVYILPKYRNKGYGKELIEKSIETFSSFTDKKISMDIITLYDNTMLHIIEKYYSDIINYKKF